MRLMRCDRCGYIGSDEGSLWGYVRVHRPLVEGKSLEADLCMKCVDTLYGEMHSWPLDKEGAEHEQSEPAEH